jgi:hypothetical protein
LATPSLFSTTINSIKISTTINCTINFIIKMDDSIIQGAIDGLDSHRFPSVRAAARHFSVNQGTLQNHINGTLSRY